MVCVVCVVWCVCGVCMVYVLLDLLISGGSSPQVQHVLLPSKDTHGKPGPREWPRLGKISEPKCHFRKHPHTHTHTLIHSLTHSLTHCLFLIIFLLIK